jgi:hypothetical protein
MEKIGESLPYHPMGEYGGSAMSPVDRRPNEWAMHECFLVIRTSPADMGARPLTGSFISPDITVGADGRPRAVVWNLGHREVEGVVTEFAYVPAGLPVRAEHARPIGRGGIAFIPAGSSVTVTCQEPWQRTSSADVLLVTAFHPELDPVKVSCDPLADRHVGQMSYAWAGDYEGRFGPAGTKVVVQIRPASRGIYRVRLFQAEDGRLPSHPQVDRLMAPSGATFRWLEVVGSQRELWELTMRDNRRVTIAHRAPYRDPGGQPEAVQTGLIERSGA